MTTRVAVIGLGEAGFTLHLPALAGLAQATVVGACDVDEPRRARAAAAFDVPVFADVDAMLAQATPDVVIVGTPPHTHAALCRQALAGGAHVLCEKPFVETDAEAAAVLEAAARAGRQVAVNHEFREMPIFRAVLDEVRQPAAGTLRFAQVWQAIDLPPWREQGWRGGLQRRTLFEAGVHLIDLLVALFGELPSTVQAACADGGLDDRERDGFVAATFTFSGRRIATLAQNRASHGAAQYLELRADTDRACWRASFGGRARVSAGLHRGRRPHVRLEVGSSGLAWRETGERRQTIGRNPSAPNAAATRTVLARTFEAFRTGGEPPTTGALARAILRVIDAAYESAASGARVAIPAG